MIMTAEEFVELRLTNDRRASWDEAPDAVWLDVIDRYPDMRTWVAHNKTISASIIHALFNLQDDSVSKTLATKRRTPPELLFLLAQHKDESIRQRVVCNPKCPQHVLELLQRDGVDRIKEHARKRLSASE